MGCIMEKARKPVYKKWWFWLIVAVVAWGIVGYAIDFNGVRTSGTETPPRTAGTSASFSDANEAETTEETTDKIDPSVDVVKSAGFTDDEATAIWGVLKSLGAKPAEDFMDQGSVFVYKSGDVFADVYIDEETNVVKHVVVDGSEIYNGTVLFQISDALMDLAKEVALKRKTIAAVKEFLKAPSTAEFPDGITQHDQWKFSRDQGISEVSSYVDSQNSFGAMIRTNFKARFKIVTEELTGLEIDGDVVIS
jgi:hypothetical protein